MHVEQIYTEGLAQAAYYIESQGEVAIIDPLRDVEPYLRRAAERQATIKYVLQTHFHADFVSGHLELAWQTDATIVYGPTAKPAFDAYVAQDGEELWVGACTLKVLHTPGHTMESSTYLLRDEAGRDYALFTGDTLFLGDVGRPDLAVKTDLSEEDLARYLYDSLRHQILPLPDDLILYPGHGAGSACGKKMDDAKQGTLGEQKKKNYALRADMSREEFVQEVLEGQEDPPRYFPFNAALNQYGYEKLDVVLARGLRPLDVASFKSTWAAAAALVLDTRPQAQFVAGHLPGSVFIGLDGHFETWVGTLLPDLRRRILLVAEAGREQEAVTRLARVGYDQPAGYLAGGLDAWQVAGEAAERTEEISAERFAELFDGPNLDVLDVRSSREYQEAHVLGAAHFPLNALSKKSHYLDANDRYYLYCGSGYRSLMATSFLQAQGLDVVNIPGGYQALSQTSLATEAGS
ncbi:MBL fold metallo-hydrolase [Rhabdobacter roseus]|uniref:Glyoxylase-like metal-dependent hydrolase (Beta-lactamase superfamily II)/rhodanese-related sulfurtransferase n=1 Tax=Rhabdobacter roseus TaxID=1655419 RepID=A0A840TNH6_9BACT|nr:MBL fold metallo-hydrolase [Rhabdobacter roseus]MBB5284485.1 glyoxylase-like metal-dependent hydrolase (beta-lactamase superfamily II)/rhodanese-related sulfurtransferase [Rhabdobacter roseus]